MADFLFYGETGHSAAMRHELPIAILDPFLLGIVAGRMHIMVSPLEVERIASAAPDAVHDLATLGLAELFDNGMAWHELDLELASRAAAGRAQPSGPGSPAASFTTSPAISRARALAVGHRRRTARGSPARHRGGQRDHHRVSV